MSKHMIAPRSMTHVPACGWVFYEGSSVTSIEVNDGDGTVTFGSAGDDGRFLVETGQSSSLLASLPAGTTTPINFDTVTISGSWVEPSESLARDQEERKP